MIVKKDASKETTDLSHLWDGIEFKCEKCGSTIQLEAEDKCTASRTRDTVSDSDKYDYSVATPPCPIKGCRTITILKFKGKKLVWTSSEGWKPK